MVSGPSHVEGYAGEIKATGEKMEPEDEKFSLAEGSSIAVLCSMAFTRMLSPRRVL